jgi:hypothetical protein
MDSSSTVKTVQPSATIMTLDPVENQKKTKETEEGKVLRLKGGGLRCFDRFPEVIG